MVEVKGQVHYELTKYDFGPNSRVNILTIRILNV